MPQTFVEKIAQKHARDLEPGQKVHTGDYISIQPAHVMTHDNSGAVIPKFREIGATRIANPGQVVFTLDHDIQNKSEKNLQKYANIEAFAQKHGIDFYPAGRGIGHQIMIEEGYAWPGTMTVASDSHSNMYGGIGCLGTPIVRTDAAAIWATGRTWWQIPAIVKVELKGRLNRGVTGKDVIISLCGYFNKDEVLNHIVEFTGSGITTLNLDDRLAIANMTTEWGTLAGVFPIDDVTLNWLRTRATIVTKRDSGEHARINDARITLLEAEVASLRPDAGAFYAKEIEFNLDAVQPHVSGPNTVKDVTPVATISRKRIKIQKAYLVSCVNSRVQDLAEAAAILKDKKVAEGVELYIAAASSEVQAESRRRGDWQALVAAGARELPAGCGPCIGLGVGLLRDGEVGISATNRNFKGRMGSRNATAYLASPAVVAASAVAGYIDYPGKWHAGKALGSIRENQPAAKAAGKTRVIPGFPAFLEGELLFCYQDNLNTDGIYPGKYTYSDNLTPEQQASVVMENYDPNFGALVRAGDILVGGFNFGTGSSREQAATALKNRGIALVVAGSFSETYKRNALNNGFLTLEAPELTRDLLQKFGTKALTVRTKMIAQIDLEQTLIQTESKNYQIKPLGAAAQELIVLGGLESWVKRQLS